MPTESDHSSAARWWKLFVDIAQVAGAVAGVLALIISVAPKESLRLWPLNLSGTWVNVALVGLAVALLLPLMLRLARAWLRRRRTKSAIHAYLAEVFETFLEELPTLPSHEPSSSLGRRLRDQSCYVDPPYRGSTLTRLASEASEIPSALSLVHQAKASLVAGRSIAIVGDPGTGKSLAAFICFAELADNYMTRGSRTPLPILIRLSGLPEEFDIGADPAPLDSRLPLELAGRVTDSDFARLLRKRGTVMILDGLDELPAANGRRSASFSLPTALDQLTKTTTLLTSRTQFLEIHAESLSFYSRFSEQYEILPLELTQQIEPYIEGYCAAQEKPAIADAIVRIVRENHALREVCARALMLRMTASVLFVACTNDASAAISRFQFTGSDTLNARIYESYTSTWLQRDHKKDGPGMTEPVLFIAEKQDLVQLIAFSIFDATASAGTAFSRFDLSDLLINRSELATVINTWLSRPGSRVELTAGTVMDDLVQRTFLIVNHRREDYRFVHKSFYEYFLARHVLSELASVRCSVTNVIEILHDPLPDEVIDFLRELLQWVEDGWARADYVADIDRDFREEFGRNAVASSLGSVLPEIGRRTDPISNSELMAIQQAANLLPIVATADTLAKLRALIASDAHPFIRRGIAVGLALHLDDSEHLRKLVDQWDTDLEARSFHMGYNRIYYGDQVYRPGVYEDDGSDECERFYAACLRHLTLPRYGAIKYMALASVQYFLESPRRLAYLRDHHSALLDQTVPLLGGLDFGDDPSARGRISVIQTRLNVQSSQTPLPGFGQEC